MGEHVVARHVVGRTVVPEFDHERRTAKGVDESFEFSARGARSLVHQRPGEWALATSREDQPLLSATRDVLQLKTRAPLLTPRQVRLAEHRRQMAVALGRTREQHQVRARGIGHARAVVGTIQGHLATKDGREPAGPRRLGETHHAVEAVVIGERECAQPEAGRLAHELLGVARPVEKTEARVRVQFGVGRHQS